MIKVIIAEEIPSLNKGEVAILEGIYESLKTLDDFKMSVFSFHPEIDKKEYENKAEIIDVLRCFHMDFVKDVTSQLNKIFIFIFLTIQHFTFTFFCALLGVRRVTKIFRGKIWKEYLTTDLIIVGHDSLITAYGYLPFVLFFKLLGKPVMIFGGGVGRQGSSLWIFFAKFILNKLDLITLREEISYKYLKEVGITKAPIYVTADPGFLMKSSSKAEVVEIFNNENISQKRPIIGLTISWMTTSRYCFPDITEKEDKYIEYVKMMSKIIGEISLDLNVDFLLISHVFGPEKEQDDRIIIKDIYANVKNKDHVKAIINEYKASQLKGVIGELDFLIGERLHSLIAAATMNVPFLAVTYPSPRMQGVLDMLNVEDCIYNVEDMAYDSYVTKIINLWSKKDDIIKKLTDNNYNIKNSSLSNVTLIEEIILGDRN